MSKKLYVGNLPFSVTDDKLREIFSAYGELSEANVIMNKYSGRSKGFGFVVVEDDSMADKAVEEMNGKEIEGRAIVVNEAKPFDPDKPRPSFNRNRFGGDRGGGSRFGGRGGGRFGGGGRDRGFGRSRDDRD